jgi:erythromycin esterase-like protein
MRPALVLAALLLAASAPAAAALAGVTELRAPVEDVADAELDALLAARIGPASVIAIGESVHGSAGLLRVQTRLVRYLVSRHGLRLIVWENPVLRSLELAHWLSACARGSATPPPLDVLYMPTAADAPLWEWLCAHNLAHPHDPVRMRGMDVWDRPWEHYDRVEALAARAGLPPALAAAVARDCPARDARSWPEVEALLEQARRDGGFRPPERYHACRAALAGVLEAAHALGARTRAADAPRAETAYELALSASTLLGWLGFHHRDGADDVESWNERDRAQGRNLMLIMEQHAAARAVLCAHASHVSHNRSPADWWGYGDFKSGVHFFQQLSGRAVFTIALTAYRATGTQGDWLAPTAANSMDRALHAAGHAFAFFAADAAFLARHPRWWMQNGNAPPLDNGVQIVPRDHFDAFFFVDRSPLERELPQRPIWRP